MFICLCGIAGSGKSTLAKEYAKRYNAIVVSTDAIREELFGSAAVQKFNDLVFKTAYSRIKEGLVHKRNVIFDATNIYKKDRISLLKFIEPFNRGFKIILVLKTPLEEAKKRNQNRERVVPEEVLERMSKNFCEPTEEEGWDEIYFFE